jgi:putative membrane protein
MPVALGRLLLTLAWPGSAQAHGGAHLDTPTALAAVGLIASAWLYTRAVRCGAGLGRGHIAAFAAGWGCVLLAVLSPLDTAAGEDFSVHMVQHQLLMIVAPPLLILGRPFTALGATLPPGALRVLALPLRMPPAAAWGLHAAALWVWHVPLLFDAALAAESVHALQHASFFGTALLFWWAVLRRVRSGMAVLYVLTTLIHAGALAALLTFAPTPLYAGTALAEQQLGGLLMWVPAGYALLLAGLVAFHRLLEAHA